MNASLEYQALAWLRYEKRCTLVTFQRAPLASSSGVPDVFGVLPSRLSVEIEIKRTLADFKANEKKHKVVNRTLFIDTWPSYFYFLIPDTLREKVEPLLPDYAGLIVSPGYRADCVKKAPRNKEARELSIKQLIRMVELQSNMITAQARTIASLCSRFSWSEYEVQI